MISTTKKQFFILTLSAWLITSVATADIVSTSTTQIVNNQNTGSSIVNFTNGSAQVSGNIGSVALGDGTLEDYVIFDDNLTAGVADVLSAGAANVIGPATSPAANFSGTNVALWNTTLPNGTSLGDDGGIRSANLSGTVDLTGYATGSIYVIYASFQNPNQVTAMSGSTSGDGLSQSGTASYVTEFKFDTLGGTVNDFSYLYTNTDTDGSRARVYGVAFDGVLLAVPEPTSALPIIGLALGFLARRRKKN